MFHAKYLPSIRMNFTIRILRTILFIELFSFDLFAHAFFVPKCATRRPAIKSRSSSIYFPPCIISPILCSTGESCEEPGSNKIEKGGIENALREDAGEEGNIESTPPFLLPENKSASRRKMELSWCDVDSCLPYTTSREKVGGENNDIELSSPATGQVIYNWADNSVETDENNRDVSPLSLPRVLLLVKRHDDSLMEEAANAVRSLLKEGGLKVMLQPEVAAKFKHYFGVDDDKIELYEVKPEPGFGGNHLATDDPLYNAHTFHDANDDACDKLYSPDLVCTLGGDGLLMYASTLFSGPCPPILCVAGGSLGFLTPFSRDEMVNAIRVSLGLVMPVEKYRNDDHDEGSDRQEHIDSVIIASAKKSQDIGSVPQLRTKFKAGGNGQINLSLRMRLECQVSNKEGIVRARFNVLNEVVIDRGNSPYLAALECFCDDVHLTTVQADGIIFSTPTGSTAYGMSAGGPVAHPAVPAILVTPICPHVLSFRSMVFPDHVVLRCFVPEDARADAAVAFDGKYRRELQRGDSVEIKMSPYPVPTINRVDHSADWLISLKRNFNFNTRARQTPL